MALKRVSKKTTTGKVAKPTVTKKVKAKPTTDTTSPKKRVSFAQKLTHSKIIEEEVNVSQDFDATPTKSILKRKLPAPADNDTPKTKKVVKVAKAAEPEAAPSKSEETPKESTSTVPAAKKTAKISKETASTAPAAKKTAKISKAGAKTKLMVTKSVKEKLLNMSAKERKAYLKELKAKKKPLFELSNEMKALWEKIRSSKTPEAVKKEKVDRLFHLVQGKCAKLIYAHDTTRVIQCLLATERKDIRDVLFDELEPELVRMTKSAYARYFVIRMLKYGTNEQRSRIFKAFDGHYTSIFRVVWASGVLERAYSDYCSAARRHTIIAEFYGPEYVFLKKTGAQMPTIQDIQALPRPKQIAVAESLFEHLEGAVAKETIKHSVCHKLLLDYFTLCSKEQRAEMIDALKERVPFFCHTREGSRAAMHCVWFSTPKERKIIVKSFRDLVVNSAKDEFAHRVLLAIFDSVDDTVLVNKIITKDLGNFLGDIINEKFGQWVLHYIVFPRDYRFFLKGTLEMLKQGDGNEHTVKDAAVRYQQIFDGIKKPLLTYMAANMRTMLFNKLQSVLVLNILEPPVDNEPFERVIDDEDKIACFKAIAEVVGEDFVPYNLESESHIIEAGCARFVLSMLLKRDAQQTGPKLSDYLAELPAEQLASFIAVNNGCFVLRNMVTSGSAKAKEAVKNAVTVKALKKSPHIGAQHLLTEISKA
uniref:PUM-HD domain-containing protein n=1 Tax=Panagrellus redivivus TaxID=6233 RepID=A0A7E4VYZ0_PANRE